MIILMIMDDLFDDHNHDKCFSSSRQDDSNLFWTMEKMWLGGMQRNCSIWIEIPHEQYVNLWHSEDTTESTVWKILSFNNLLWPPILLLQLAWDSKCRTTVGTATVNIVRLPCLIEKAPSVGVATVHCSEALWCWMVILQSGSVSISVYYSIDDNIETSNSSKFRNSNSEQWTIVSLKGDFAVTLSLLIT